MKAKAVRRGTKKNNVTLREKDLSNGKKSLYLDIYRDKTRSYEFLKLYIDNKARTPIEKQVNKETYELAEKIRTEKERELNHTAFGLVVPTKQKVSFFTFAQSHEESYQKKDIKMIRGVIQRFKDFLTTARPKINQRTLKINEIDKTLIIDFVEYLESKSEFTGAQSYYQRFKKILNRAVDEGLILKSPAHNVRTKNTEAKQKAVLTNEEIIMLSKTDCQNMNIKRAFLYCCTTGLRFCDVNVLRYSDIDFSSKRMILDQQQKTGKTVIVDLNTTALKLIGEPQRADNKVFELPTSTACNKTLKAWVKRAGINKHITWHCARHSLAVNLLTLKGDSKPDIKTVSSILGHSSLKHTEKYTRIVDEIKKDAINALPDYF